VTGRGTELVGLSPEGVVIAVSDTESWDSVLHTLWQWTGRDRVPLEKSSLQVNGAAALVGGTSESGKPGQSRHGQLIQL
jgi:hypothetical protein